MIGRWRRRRRERAAEERWMQRNAAADRDPKCLCGKRGIVRVTSPYEVVGRVRPAFWNCKDHKDVPLTAPWYRTRDGQWLPVLEESFR